MNWANYQRHKNWKLLIQLATIKIIHRSQELSLNDLAFGPTNVKNHGLLYIVIACIQAKEWLYLSIPFQHQNFHIDQHVVEEMNRLKKFANWTTLFFDWKTFIIHILLYKPSIQFLYNDITKI